MTDTLKRILLVDDDDDIREIACVSLEVFGEFTVEQCASGAEAIEKAEAFQPDLLLLDVMMPGMSGQETLAEIRKIPSLSGILAAFLTAKADWDTSSDPQLKGALCTISKPFDPEEIGPILRRAWAKRKN